MNSEIAATVMGSRLGARRGRRPRTREAGRVCVSSGCDTILSKYNLNDTCRVHTATRFPRTRGKPARAS